MLRAYANLMPLIHKSPIIQNGNRFQHGVQYRHEDHMQILTSAYTSNAVEITFLR